MAGSRLEALPAEVRQQILSHLPAQQLRKIQFLSRHIYDDIDVLFSSQAYLESSLSHLEASILLDHRLAVRAFRANRRPDLHTPARQDSEVRNAYVLLQLLRYVARLREEGFHAERAVVKQVTLKCRSALKSCSAPSCTALWSDDLQRLMYPVAVRMPYRFVAEI